MKIDVTQSNFSQEFSKKDAKGKYEIGIDIEQEKNACCDVIDESKYDKSRKLELLVLPRRSKSI